MMPSAIPATQDCAFAFTIPEAVRYSGLSRSRLYRLAAEGWITPRQIGDRTLVLAADLRALLEGLPPAPIRVRAPAP